MIFSLIVFHCICVTKKFKANVEWLKALGVFLNVFCHTLRIKILIQDLLRQFCEEQLTSFGLLRLEETEGRPDCVLQHPQRGKGGAGTHLHSDNK